MRTRLNSNNARFAAGSPLWKAIIPLLALAATAQIADASERRFAYVYEATTQPKGAVEYEQWVTWKTDKADDSSFNRFDIRHELEFGLTDHLQLGIYLSDWRHQQSDSGSKTEWRDFAAELIYNLSDPVEDAIGSALYGEVKVGDEFLELEGKILLQKNVGKWALAWNGTIEAEWEGDSYSQDKGAFEQTLGASYQFNPKFLVGAELLHEIEFDDWSETGDDVVYLGPNVSFRTGTWWLTIAPLFQVTSIDGEPDFQTRFLLGFDF